MQDNNSLRIEDLIEALSTNSMLMITDAHGRFTRVNKQTCEITGYQEEELIGNTYEEIFGKHSTQQEHIGHVLIKTIGNGEIWQGEVKRMNKKGEIYWTYTIVYPIKNESNQVTGIIGISQIVTRQKIIKEQFYEQSKHFNSLAFTNSHVLRNPLVTILGLCGLFSDDVLESNNENLQKMLKNISTTAQELDLAVHKMQAQIQQARNGQATLRNKLTNGGNTIKRIMLIDDDDLSHLITKRILQYATNFNLEVIKFKNVKEALDYFLNEINPLPDMILLDLDMPRMDGWDFLKEFGKLHLDIPINILTNSIFDTDKYKAIQYDSVRGFWSKPLRVEQATDMLKQ